jgi:hypothetical protein
MNGSFIACFNRQAGDQHQPPPPKKTPAHGRGQLQLPRRDFIMSYAQLEIDVIRWAEARQIVQNSNNLAQAVKTLEEVTELLDAIVKGDRKAQQDAYGKYLALKKAKKESNNGINT